MSLEYNLEGTPETMRAPLQRYAETLKELAGDNARSLTLFGAIAAGTFNPRSHTARSVFVVGDVDLDMLHRLARQGPRLGKARIAAPLIMTPEYIDASMDTFPLEFLEIAQHHICVFGEDYFRELPLEAADVRHECEREIKTIQLGMRQALLAAAGRDKALTTVEVDVGERLAAVPARIAVASRRHRAQGRAGRGGRRRERHSAVAAGGAKRRGQP